MKVHQHMSVENEQSEPDEGIISGYLAAFIAEAEAVCRKGRGQAAGHGDAVCSRFFELLFHKGGEGSSSSQSAKFSVSFYADRLQITPNQPWQSKCSLTLWFFFLTCFLLFGETNSFRT